MTTKHETGHRIVDQIVTGHFREGPGYATWRSRGTADWLLIATLGGRGRFGYAGGEFLSQPGDMVLLRPGALHDYGVDEALQHWELLWAHFRPRPDWLEWLDWPVIAPGLLRLHLPAGPPGKGVIERFFLVHEVATTGHRRRDARAMNAMETMLLACDGLNPQARHAEIDERIRSVVDHICRHIGQPMTLENLADISSLSVSRMAHLFRDQVGATPQQFLEQQRMHRAIELLRFTPRSVKQIARDVGYDNPFYFTLRFKKHTGQSPRAYRQSHC